MARLNPGPFEPVVYVLQTPLAFRVLGVGGLALFTLSFLTIAARHGAGYAMVGLVLLGAFWFESSITVCRRCRFYGTWHCGGQGMLVAKLFAARPRGIPDARLYLHAALVIGLVMYGLFWIWHSPMLGTLFTLWLPLAVLSAIAPNGFSWRHPPAQPKAA
jgi:hypothetical protein